MEDNKHNVNGITVLLADDHKIMRDGLHTLLETQDDISVVAETEDGRGAVQLAGKYKPDVVIMDIAMPKLNGIEATSQITRDYPDVKVISLSMHSDKRFIAEMLKAGVSGYLLKDCAFEELITAIRSVVSGKFYLSPCIAGVVVEDFVSPKAKDGETVFSVLSSREREVLQLLSEGKRTKEIATQLHLSVKTVETHRMKIMSKLNINNLAELTKYAIREGLTSL